MNAQLLLALVAALAVVLIGAAAWRGRARRPATGPGIVIDGAWRPLDGARRLGRSDWPRNSELPPDVVEDHAELLPAVTGAWDVRLLSGRHMFVNGWRSRHNRVRSGDVIALGSGGQAVLQFVAAGDAAPRAIAAIPPAGAELLPIGEVISDPGGGAQFVVTSALLREDASQTYQAVAPDGAQHFLLHEGLTPGAVDGVAQLSGALGQSRAHVARLLPAFSLPWFDGLARHVVPEVEQPGRLSDADLREQPKAAWLAWTEQLVIGLCELHAAGVALGLNEQTVMSHVGIAPDGGRLSAYWRRLGDVIPLAADAEAEFADVCGLAQAMLRTKLLEAPSHVRQALQVAARPAERVGAAALARRLGVERDPSGAPAPVLDGQGEHRVEVGHATSRGMLRDDNEDSLCALEVPVAAGASYLHRPVLLAVADGMGGVDAGEVASALTIDLLTAATEALFADEGAAPAAPQIAAWIQATVRDINAAVVAEGTRNGTQMGSTLAFALIVDGTAYLGNVGDCRVYRWHAGPGADGLVRLVRDHSLVQSLVDAGVLTDEERYSHPERSLVLRSLGDPRTGISDDNAPLSLQPGDWLLICSDGLWEMVRDDAIRDVLARAPNAQVACDRLVDLANANGGEDNISVAIGRYM